MLLKHSGTLGVDAWGVAHNEIGHQHLCEGSNDNLIGSRIFLGLRCQPRR
jgi:hypothetical protein